MSAEPHQWIISQIGSRQHYAVPRGFETNRQLKRLYTDAWCPGFCRGWLLKGKRPMRAFATRWHAEIPRRKIVSQNRQALMDGARRWWGGPMSTEAVHLDHLRVGECFDQFVAAHLQRNGRVEPGRDAFFGFNTGCLATLNLLRRRGVITVLDQIDPGKIQEDIIFGEMAKWPGWEPDGQRIPQTYWNRMKAEWDAADLVVVNSKWSRTALIMQGVAAEKIRVIAIPYEPEVGPIRMPRRDGGPLTVLWLGSVILRKGIQYLIEAAKLLKDTTLNFVIAGPIGISQKAVASAPANMTFMGGITRDQTDRIYHESDIFVLPTLSDGFAVTQVEAMSKGLAIITTPNCGEVVMDGIDGLIVPAGDSLKLAQAIAKLDQDRELLAEMSHQAVVRSTQFLLPTQARQIEAAISELESKSL